MTTDIFKEIQGDGYQFKVYDPLDSREELINFPGEPVIPEIKPLKIDLTKDSLINKNDS